jgi:hypothetical protein
VTNETLPAGGATGTTPTPAPCWCHEEHFEMSHGAPTRWAAPLPNRIFDKLVQRVHPYPRAAEFEVRPFFQVPE